MDLTRDDSGARRAARLGEHIVIRLPENPTTGYRWAAEVDPAMFELMDDQYEGAVRPVGGGGERVLTFAALRVGHGQIRLANRRAWEAADPVDEFTVDLEVQDS
jgi:inhibitor of cysteine peptidase